MERGGVRIADGGEFAAADFFVEQVIGVVSPDVAHADDAEPDFVHEVFVWKYLMVRQANSAARGIWDRNFRKILS